MRLVLLSDAIRPPLTGIGRYTWELAKRLRYEKEVDDLRLLGLGRWETFDDLERILKLSSLGDQAAHSSSSAQRLSTLQALRRVAANVPLAAKSYEYLRSQLGMAVLRRCAGHHGTVVHGPNYFAPLTSAPTVITVHDLSTLLYPQWHPSTRVARVNQMLEVALKHRFTLVTDAHSTAADLVRLCRADPALVHCVPLGVDDSFRPWTTDEAAPVLSRYGLAPGRYSLSVATFEPRKNLLRLMEAYGKLPCSLRVTLPLVLVGADGWLDEALKARVELAVAQQWVRRIGYVHDTDLPALYSSARLFVYVSIYEGFGLPIAEAMACGAPVVTSNTSSLPEVAGGAAILANPLDVDSIYHALHRGIEDEQWRDSARELGTRHAKALNWTKTVQQMVIIYQQMLASHHT